MSKVSFINFKKKAKIVAIFSTIIGGFLLGWIGCLLFKNYIFSKQELKESEKKYITNFVFSNWLTYSIYYICFEAIANIIYILNSVMDSGGFSETYWTPTSFIANYKYLVIPGIIIFSFYVLILLLSFVIATDNKTQFSKRIGYSVLFYGILTFAFYLPIKIELKMLNLENTNANMFKLIFTHDRVMNYRWQYNKAREIYYKEKGFLFNFDFDGVDFAKITKRYNLCQNF